MTAREGRLSGHRVLITGASSGLGRRFATTLASEGAELLLCARRGDRLAELRSKIEDQGGKAETFLCDVSDADAIATLIDHLDANDILPDMLVNAAGMADANYAVRLSLEKIDQVIAVNFRAPFLMCAGIARHWIDRKISGRIVNIASNGAFHYPHKAAAALYSAAKGGVVRMTETLALEWAEFGINVNAIAPGLFETEMSQDWLRKVGDRATADYPRRRAGQPEQLDSTILYLLDPASDFVTGTCIIVDDAQAGR